MNILFKIGFKKKINKIEYIYFGLPTEKNEFEEMYKLRYEVYANKGLMEVNNEKKDFDYIDLKNCCYYFVAKYNNEIIGSTRAIYNYLPTEETYFDISLPEEVIIMDKNKKLEIGRLSVKNTKNKYFPRHMILLGLFYVMSLYSKEKGYLMGLGTLKDYVKKKLINIRFPLNIIIDHRLKYKANAHNDPLINFFNEDKTGKVWPVYTRIRDIEVYLKTIFFNKVAFRVIDDNRVILKNKFLFNFVILLKIIKKK